jgi:hypothetical protein
MTIRLLLMIVTALFALPLPLLSAERDYIRELESLPREGRTACLQSLTESDFLSFGHQCYREAVDEESILMVVFGEGLLPLWKKSPPSPDVYLPMISNEKLLLAWRCALTESLALHASAWEPDDFSRYYDCAMNLLRNEGGAANMRAKLPVAISRAMSARMKQLGGKPVLKQQEFTALHGMNASVVEYLAQTIRTHTETNDEALVRACVYALGNFVAIYRQDDFAASTSFDRAKAAKEDAVKTLGATASDERYHPDIIAAALRELYRRDLGHVISRDDIERLRQSKNFIQNPEATRSLDYWAKELEKKAKSRDWQKPSTADCDTSSGASTNKPSSERVKMPPPR